jgi:hypothetical protein
MSALKLPEWQEHCEDALLEPEAKRLNLDGRFLSCDFGKSINAIGKSG